MRQHGVLPWPEPGDLDPAARSVYDAIARGPRAHGPRHFRLTDADGRLEGPFNAMVTAPAVGHALQALGAALRYGGELSDRSREVAILAVAVALRSDFEWYAHAPIARSVGLSDADLGIIAADAALAASLPEASGAEPTLSAEELVVLDASRALLRTDTLPDDLLDSVLGTLGNRGLVELVVLVGYYRTLSTCMHACRTPLPDGVPSPFAEVPDRE
jgi:alkylhydroperoxidase/carboxymuconolactone decarboxylase family protein YurZ